MKIVIIGAGEVGFYLGGLLSRSNHDVIILDNDKEALKRVSEKLDVLTVEGNATSPNVLVEAGVQKADIVVAATSVDEVNMIASMMSKRLGVKRVIARVRSQDFSKEDAPLKAKDMGIDVIIHPEYSAALDIVQLLKRSDASDVINIADGKMQLVGLKLTPQSSLVGLSMIQMAQQISDVNFRVVCLTRGAMTIIPKGNTKLQKNDQVFILAKVHDVKAIVQDCGYGGERSFNKVMIAGGTEIGELVAQMLCQSSKKWNIKLIEPDYDKAYALAEHLPDALVLHGNPADPDLLAAEGIDDVDAFISVTDDEESNIISCLMAKHLEVRKTVALVSKPSYIPLSQTIGLDAAVNVKLSVSNEIHRYVREGQVVAVTALHGIDAEVIQFVVNADSKLVNKPLHTIRFPKGAVIGGVIRKDEVEIAIGSTVIKEGDEVIIFSLPTAVNEVSKSF